jgi:hypothetical protein
MATQPSEQSSYEQLKSRIHRHAVQEKRVGERIVELVQSACEDALSAERVLLSRAERARLIQHVLRDILLEMADQEMWMSR